MSSPEGFAAAQGPAWVGMLARHTGCVPRPLIPFRPYPAPVLTPERLPGVGSACSGVDVQRVGPDCVPGENELPALWSPMADLPHADAKQRNTYCKKTPCPNRLRSDVRVVQRYTAKLAHKHTGSRDCHGPDLQGRQKAKDRRV